MSNRKQTPDILGEILGTEPATSPTPPTSERATTPAKPKRATKPRRTSPSKQKTAQWEYQVVSFQEYKGWRPRYVNGKELKNWMDGPLLHDYLTQMGEEGWELATASSGERMYGLSDRHQLFFKRPK